MSTCEKSWQTPAFINHASSSGVSTTVAVGLYSKCLFTYSLNASTTFQGVMVAIGKELTTLQISGKTLNLFEFKNKRNELSNPTKNKSSQGCKVTTSQAISFLFVFTSISDTMISCQCCS